MLGALCWLGVAAWAQAPLVETDLRPYPVRLESHGRVLSWENDEVKVFVVPSGGQVRQGPLRMAAAGLVVWLDKEVSRRSDVRAATVRVYAEGAGVPGNKASKPVFLVEKRRVQEASVICLRLRSGVGFSWNCTVAPVEDLQGLPLYRRAESATRGAPISFVLDTLPETPRVTREKAPGRVLEADEFHSFGGDEEGPVAVVYLGDVHGWYEKVQINADVAVVWFDESTGSYEIYARGNVLLKIRRKALPGGLPEESRGLLESFESVRADEIYINPRRERGLASRAELRFRGPEQRPQDIYVVRGREVYILDSQNLYMREGGITTCPFGHPHYQFSAERARLVHYAPSLFLSGWDVEIRAGREERTLIGLPFLATDLGRGEGFLLASSVLGSSIKFGPFLKTRWRPGHVGLAPDWVEDWLVHLDYYGARGPGLGTELQYGFGSPGGPRHSGVLDAYYLQDSGEEDDTGLPVSRADRGRFWLQHRAQWDERWRTDVELYWLSDSGFLNEYFEGDFEGKKAPENYLFTRYRRDTFWGGLLFSGRLNEFLTRLEEQPSLELQWIGVPTGPLVHYTSFEAGLYDLEVSNELAMADPPSLVRAHAEHRISRPLSVGFVRLDPFVRALVTWASIGAPSGGLQSGSLSRVGGGGGVRASADFSRSYDIRSKLFALNRLRHVLTPFAELELLPFMSADSEDFIQLGGQDPWPRGGGGAPAGTDRVDGIDRRGELRVGLRQRLQTKRRRGDALRTVDWIELDAALVSRSDDSVAVVRDDDYLDVDFNWLLRPGLTFFSRDNRISLEGGTDVYNLGTALTLRKQTRLLFGYHYVGNLSSSVSATLTGRLSDRYSLSLLETFELGSRGTSEAENLETDVTLRRFLHKWILDLRVRYDKANEDMVILLVFSPMGLDFQHW